MDLKDPGPRDWTPAPAPNERPGPLRAGTDPYRPPSYGRVRRARSGAWATLVIGVVALVVSLTQFQFGSTTTYILSTLGLVAVGTGFGALRRVSSGHPGSRSVAILAIVFGMVATVVTILRFLTVQFFPSVSADFPALPAIAAGGEQSTAARSVPVSPSGRSEEEERLALSQSLGTAIVVLRQQPSDVELAGLYLSDGYLELVTGQKVATAGGAKSVRFVVEADGVHYKTTVEGTEGAWVHFDSATGYITSK
jgi:hypothetical protein